MAEESKVKFHILTLLIVGGALLFAFVVYMLLLVATWLFTNPSILVYAFMVLFTVEAYWLLFAFLKRRLGVRRGV